MMPSSTRHEHMDEALLVQSAQAGDEACFEELIRRHSQVAFRVAYNVVRSHEDAEEIVQEAFLKAFLHIKDFEQRAQFSSWIIRIALNTALMKLRSARTRSAISITTVPDEDGDSLPREVAEWRANPEQEMARSELRGILESALQSLPPAYSTIFILRDIEERSVAETAEILGVTIPTVKTRLLRARLKLREQLARHFQRSPRARRDSHELMAAARALVEI